MLSLAAPSPNRRATGAYYTPALLARLVTRLALHRYLQPMAALPDELLPDRKPLDALPVPSVPAVQWIQAYARPATDSTEEAFMARAALRSLRVLDPAVGCGVFLLSCLEEIAAIGPVDDPGSHLLGSHLGTAVDRDRSDHRANLASSMLYGLDVDEAAVDRCRNALLLAACAPPHLVELVRQQLEAHIRCADSLAEPEGLSFDIVIGNPPWGATLNPTTKETLRARFGLTGIVDSFGLFLLHGISQLKPGGCLAMILPDIVLLKHYPQLRKQMLSMLTLTDIVMLNKTFPAVTLGAMILVGRRKSETADVGINSVTTWQLAEDGILRKLSAFDQSTLLSDDDQRFRILIPRASQALQQKLEMTGVKLGEILEAHEGIHSGNVRQKLFVAPPAPAAGQRLLFGRDEVHRFRIRWAGRYVRYDRSLVDRDRGEYANFGKPAWFAAPKIVVRRTGDFLLAAFDAQGYYCSNNLFVARLHSPPNSATALRGELLSLVALLNSRLLTWYFRSIQPRAGRPFAELKLVHLRRLPIALPAETERSRLASLAEKLAMAAMDCNTGASQLTRDQRDLYHALDDLVYQLYHLTDHEKQLVEGNAVDYGDGSRP